MDYKTGKYANARPKLKPPSENELKPGITDHNKLYGGDYWRQLYFYKVLLESDRGIHKPVLSGLLDFVEPDQNQYPLEKIMFNEREDTMVKQQITDAYTRIMRGEFEEGCNEDHCEWCTFNKYYMRKEYHQTLSLLREEQEEMEER